MCSNCSNYEDVMKNHYSTELADDDAHILFRMGNGSIGINLTGWPTWISSAPTIEHLNSLIGG